MIGPLRPGVPYEAFADGFPSGEVGVVGVRLDDGQGNTIVAFTTDDIIEIVPISGFSRYRYNGTSPATGGTYLLVWDDGIQSTSEELVVSYTSITPEPGGPCGSWITGDDVAVCCDADVGTNFELLDEVAGVAVSVMFQLSGRRFSGECGPVTVRPCAFKDTCGCFDDWHSWGQEAWDGWGWDGRMWACGTRRCGCQPLSEVTLAGYPVNSIVAVKIDGVVLGIEEYRLDYNRELVRMRDTANPSQRRYWPGCQILDLPDTEPGTWSVTYLYGQEPPQLALDAAAQLACQFYKSCPEGGGECELPPNVRQLTRQGVSYDLVTPLAEALRSGATGLMKFDAFMASYGVDERRRAAFWGPDLPGYPRPAG